MKIFRFRDVLPELPNIVFRRRFKFNFELLPYEVKGLSLKKIGNFFLAGLNQFLLPSKPLGYPVIAQVEPTNFCNLSCPLCLTTSETGSRPRSVLSFNIFKNFIDEVGDYLLLIVLWNWGEPFLNPDIFRIIAYAKSKNILVHTSTNGNVKFDNEKAEKLVDSGLDSLVFAVDGATQETYSKYRKGGNLELVCENIRTIVRAKREKGCETPRLNLRFIVMKHNEKELPLINQLAEELQVDFLTLRALAIAAHLGENLVSTFSPDNPRYRGYRYNTDNSQGEETPFTCMRPWKRITLGALGEIISCEYDYKDRHSFGNLNTEKSPISIWKGAIAKEFRKKFNLGNNDFFLCRDCIYKNMVVDDCTIEVVPLNWVCWEQ